MNIEVFSRCKYRDNDRPGDDVPLVLPGVCLGVFDGATDVRGNVIAGVPAARLAALTAAEVVSELFLDRKNRELPARQLVDRICEMYAEKLEPFDLPQLPATTLSLAIDCGDQWRLFCLGDSGIRLNADTILRHSKLIDDVATHARVALFKHLRDGGADPETTELTARRGIFLGLSAAVRDGVLSETAADEIIHDTIRSLDLAAEADAVRDFLKSGICKQGMFANVEGSALCYDVLANGSPKLGDWIDERIPKSEIHTIEVFSDGYATLPSIPTIAAWEEEFERAEELDFHRICDLATVKGGTKSEFFDDRTVVIADCNVG